MNTTMSESEAQAVKKIDKRTGTLLNITDLSVAAEGLISKEEIIPGEANIFWKYCHVDRSCVVIQNKCKQHFGVHYSNEERLRNYLKKNENDLICPKNIPSTKHTSKCINNFCS